MTPDLMRRIAITLGALLVYRLGVHIPVPGIQVTFWQAIFRSHTSGILGQANMLSGGAVRALGIFSLGLVPYITAAIFMQLAGIVSAKLRALRHQGERGRQILERRTRYLALLLALPQAYGVAVGLESGGSELVPDPGVLFRLSTMLTLAGGMMLLVWLSGQITARGIGNGIAFILLAGIVTELPRDIAETLQLRHLDMLSSNDMIALVLVAVAVTGFVVLIERARRRLPVDFPTREVGGRTLPAQQSHLSFKLNPAGIIPVAIASWLVLIGLTLYGLVFGHPETPSFAPGEPLHLAVSAVAIVFLALLYTAVVCDPAEIAESLQTYGGAIPDVAPGEPTAAHVDQVLSRTALVGGIYLAAVVLLPEILTAVVAAPVLLGGQSLLLLVCVTLDVEAQVRARWQGTPDGAAAVTSPVQADATNR